MHELLVTYLYGEASRDECARFEAHRDACAACRQELAAFEQVRETLQQWQLEDLPQVRVVVEPPRPSALQLLKELFVVMPLWAKGFGAVATALLLFTALGLEVSVGGDGFKMRSQLFGGGESPATATTANPGAPLPVALSDAQLNQLRAELLKEVEVKIAASEQSRQEELRARFVSFAEQLQGMRSADLIKLAARVQEHNAKLKNIERDIDRREGLGGLSDILFGEATTTPGERTGTPTDGD